MAYGNFSARETGPLFLSNSKYVCDKSARFTGFPLIALLNLLCTGTCQEYINIRRFTKTFYSVNQIFFFFFYHLKYVLDCKGNFCCRNSCIFCLSLYFCVLLEEIISQIQGMERDRNQFLIKYYVFYTCSLLEHTHMNATCIART